MTDLTQLIQRLEKAEAGSRELDARVEVAALTSHCWIKLPNDEHRLRKGRVLVKGFPEELTAFADAEPVTTSLDAAIALVERALPGWSILLAFSTERAVCDVHTKQLGDPSGRWPGHAEAKTPALALCIAALKALQNKESAE